ncbi:MAG TPA: hypothetical protein VHG30_09215 [Microvirga sp.]|jgi:hypothetical protein|nr:hypothetical protein [Microvirga sp.]
MAEKPQNENAPNPAVPESGPAVESVRTTTEAEAVLRKREAEGRLGESPSPEGAARPAGDSPKPHGDKFESTFGQASPEEPIQDEP